jgi:plastocyanin
VFPEGKVGRVLLIRRRRAAWSALLLILPAHLVGCGRAVDDSPKRRTGSAEAKVVLRLIAFRPDKLEVSPGTKVVWSQTDAGVHTVTSGSVEQGTAGVTKMPDGKFDSGEIPTGDEFSYTFEGPGTYPYFCSVHPATMRGEVSVR